MYSILIIEDEPAYQRILKDAFKKHKCKVSVAPNGKQGIIQASKQLPSFIVLDLIMPVMNGAIFLHQINSVKQLRNVPIAILTAVPDGITQKIQGNTLFKHVIGYWVKYITTPEAIVKKVTTYLDQHPNKITRKRVSV